MATVNQHHLYTQLLSRLRSNPRFAGPGGHSQVVAREVASVYGPVLSALEQRIKALEVIVAGMDKP